MQGDKMLFFIFSCFRIKYKKSRRKRKSDDDVEWEKKKTKRKSKDVESLFCIIHLPTVADHGNFTSFDDGKDTLQKKMESSHKVRDVRLLEDVQSTK